MSSPVRLVQRHVHALHDVSDGDGGGAGDAGEAVHQDSGVGGLGPLWEHNNAWVSHGPASRHESGRGSAPIRYL